MLWKRSLSEKILTNGELKIKINSCVFNLSDDFWSAMGGKKADRRSSSRLVSQIVSRDFNERIEVANKRSGFRPALKLLEEE